MSLNPADLANDLDLLERIEKATLRFVARAIDDFRTTASTIFANEADQAADIGEDITREALDRIGTSVIPIRLFGKMDYKRARYVFMPEFELRQALFVDSKAEDVGGANTATIQMAQTSMAVRQRRDNTDIDVQGSLPTILTTQGQDLLTTTLFVKYNYRKSVTAASGRELVSISLIALPSGMLQDRYNPSAQSTFWLAGRDAPTLGEAFRARIGLNQLSGITRWRVQRIRLLPTYEFTWQE